jgi:hypothetical protein
MTEIETDGQQSPDVQRAIEEEFGLFEPEQVLKKHQVPRAAHRQKLGQTLNDP